MIEDTVIQAAGSLSPIAQYGAVGIALVALVLVYLVVKEHRRDMKDVIKGNTEAMVKNGEAVAALTASLPHACRAKERI